MEWKIGCSGFYYKEWKEIFYPQGLPQKNWFSYYCEHFNTIEINSTFYKMPTLKSFEKWYADSPADFLFTIKAPRLITHYKLLHDCNSLTSDFYRTISDGLKEKLGCILFQFPPRFSYNENRLQQIISLLPSGFDNVVEFRHTSWWSEEVYEKLAAYGIIFCGQSFPSDLPDEPICNQPTLYYRFHGKPVLYKSEYDAQTIIDFKNQIPTEAERAFVYFNNTWGIGALNNSRELQSITSQFPPHA